MTDVQTNAREDRGVASLLACLHVVAARAADAVAGQRGQKVCETHPLRRPSSTGVADDGAGVRVGHLARTFGLTPLDVELLLVAMAPEVDHGMAHVYAELQGDSGDASYATVSLALELSGASAASADDRGRFDPSAPLLRWRLLDVGPAGAPFLTRKIRAPDRVTSFLLGGDEPDIDLDGLRRSLIDVDVEPAGLLADAMRQGVWFSYVRERTGTDGYSVAAGAFARHGVRPLALDLRRLADDEVGDVAAVAVREAALLDTGLVLGPVDVLVERHPRSLSLLADAPLPVVLIGTRAWHPAWSPAAPLLLDAPQPDAAVREEVWLRALGAAEVAAVRTVTGSFRLTPDQILAAAQAARTTAASAGRAIDADHLRAAARAQNAGRLEHLARRVEPSVTFDDLVLPDGAMEQVRETVIWARHRETVVDAWGMGSKGTTGRGVTALFVGESGTGKTLAAEVVAGSLGLDLYVIDLATVVDKYIGETEKNLERIFSEAEGVNGVLFFDEADALFGKRSEVSDAKDRFANVEIAYLLQRMEQFDGVAVLATNLWANLDQAFTRRIDVLVQFPVPGKAERRRLWETHLPPDLPHDGDWDLDFLATAFELSGGDIRNITVAAAYLAAEAGRPVAMSDLVRATAREYRKLGRLCTASEFGTYVDLLRG